MPVESETRPSVIRSYEPKEFVTFWGLDRFAPGIRETLLVDDVVWIEERGGRSGEPSRRLVCRVAEPRDQFGRLWVSVEDKQDFRRAGHE